MNFHAALLKEDIVIKKLYTVHYFEFSKEYKFIGEKHDFWEMVYVDKGEVTVTAGDKQIALKQGSAVFHKPNEWHNICADGKTAPNIAIVTFECNSEAMRFFCDKTLSVGQMQKTLLSQIIAEYSNAFSSPLNDPFTNQLKSNKNPAFGAKQLIKCYLCELLISFIRNDSHIVQKSLSNINYSSSVLNILISYMDNHISENITLDELADICGASKKTIENTFRQNIGKSAIEYFIYLKIEKAKKYLREENYNITQIAELLGYANIHYFSRQFKKVTGMSPMEYSVSIKAITQTVKTHM